MIILPKQLLVAGLALLTGLWLAFDTARAQTPAEAYVRGCGGCHSSDRKVLRAISRVPAAERRAWIEAFMALHPCEHDKVKPLIVEYLLERTAR